MFVLVGSLNILFGLWIMFEQKRDKKNRGQQFFTDMYFKYITYGGSLCIIVALIEIFS